MPRRSPPRRLPMAVLLGSGMALLAVLLAYTMLHSSAGGSGAAGGSTAPSGGSAVVSEELRALQARVKRLEAVLEQRDADAAAATSDAPAGGAAAVSGDDGAGGAAGAGGDGASGSSNSVVLSHPMQAVRWNNLNPAPRYPVYFRLLGCPNYCRTRTGELMGLCSDYEHGIMERVRMAGGAATGGQLIPHSLIWDTTWICKLGALGKTRFKYSHMRKGQTVNQIPNIRRHVYRKDQLCVHMRSVWGNGRYDFFLPCFKLPDMMQDLMEFQEASKRAGRPLAWAVKKTRSSGGKDVVFRGGELSPEDAQSLDYVQWFLQPPALILGRKFDMRIYALVPSFDPMRVYIFTQCYLRRTSVDWQDGEEHLSNLPMHIVNHKFAVHQFKAVENKPEKLWSIPFPIGNNANSTRHLKWGLREAMAYFAREGADTKKIWLDIRTAIVKALASVERPLSCHNDEMPYPCGQVYQQFGVDVQMDAQYRPYLIEVNTQPDQYRDSGTMSRIQGAMMSDSFRLMGIIPYALQVKLPLLQALLTQLGHRLPLKTTRTLARMLNEYAWRGGWDLALPHPLFWKDIAPVLHNVPAGLYEAFLAVRERDFVSEIMRVADHSDFRDEL